MNAAVQAPASADTALTTGSTIEDALHRPQHAGVTVCEWTLRWSRDQWGIGKWKTGKSGPRWVSDGWYGRFDHALRRLLELNVGGEVPDLAEAVMRVERAYRSIGAAVQAVVADEADE